MNRHEEIERLEAEVQAQPEKREAQKVLAREVTKLVHGGEALESALNITSALFSGDIQSLSRTEIEEAFKDVPSTTLEQEDVALIDLLISVGAAPSKRQARQDIESGAVTVNGVKVTDLEATTKQLGQTRRFVPHYSPRQKELLPCQICISIRNKITPLGKSLRGLLLLTAVELDDLFLVNFLWKLGTFW